MKSFIVSARNQTHDDIEALAGQLIPILARFARISFIVDQWTNFKSILLFFPPLVLTVSLGQLDIHRRGPLGIQAFIEFWNSDAGAAAALNWAQHVSCLARARAKLIGQARACELVPVLILSTLVRCLFLVADAPVIWPVLGALDAILNGLGDLSLSCPFGVQATNHVIRKTDATELSRVTRLAFRTDCLLIATIGGIPRCKALTSQPVVVEPGLVAVIITNCLSCIASMRLSRLRLFRLPNRCDNIITRLRSSVLRKRCKVLNQRKCNHRAN